MRALLAFVSVTVVAASVVACSGTSTSSGSGSSGTSGSPSPTTTPGTDGGPAQNDASTPSTTTPAASTVVAPVDLGGTCAAFTACGGNPQGTYDYSAGCVSDALAAARAQCPALDTSNAKATVTGSLYFEGNALQRDAVVHLSGTIVVPESCSAGQCATVQAALTNGFDSVSCTGSSACTCTISKTTAVKNATTFLVSGDTVTTGDGESYSICEQANELRYSGKSLGAEDGSWQLTKRP